MTAILRLSDESKTLARQDCDETVNPQAGVPDWASRAGQP
jgi:hypothetical protein